MLVGTGARHAPVARRPRFCACTVRASAEESVLEREAGSAAGCDGVDVELR